MRLFALPDLCPKSCEKKDIKQTAEEQPRVQKTNSGPSYNLNQAFVTMRNMCHQPAYKNCFKFIDFLTEVFICGVNVMQKPLKSVPQPQLRI